MAFTKVDIANSALAKIGARRIVSFSDDTKEGQLVSARYDYCRRVVASMHPWGCLKARQTLSPDVDAPGYGYSAQFTLPSDCLRLLPMDSLYSMDYVVEGRKILCDQDTLYIAYIKDEEDVSKYDWLFSEAVALYLAQDLAYALAESDSLAGRLGEQFERILRSAKSADAQGKAMQVVDADEWIKSRFQGVDFGYRVDNQKQDG